jgi:histidine triad (HIT) family protein
MDACIFCRIAKGEIPCAKIYENEKVIAFLDISPVSKGHTLVVPKEHFKTILDMPEKLVSEVMSATKRVSAMVKKGVDADGFNIMMNNYEAAGQVVPHAHVHIVPRFLGDGLSLWEGSSMSPQELAQIKERIISYKRS